MKLITWVFRDLNESENPESISVYGRGTSQLVWLSDFIAQRFKTFRSGFSNFLLEEHHVLHLSVPQTFHLGLNPALKLSQFRGLGRRSWFCYSVAKAVVVVDVVAEYYYWIFN